MTGSCCRLYQVSHWARFAATLAPQGDQGRFYPRSPLCAAKDYGPWMTPNHREAVSARARASAAVLLTLFLPVSADNRRRVSARFGHFPEDHVHDRPRTRSAHGNR